MSSKKPITFINSNGRQLVGILHQPSEDAPKRDTAIVLLSPGIKNRVAPHRLYVKMAERFTDLGYLVFRFDPEGIGDSEGKIVESLTADVLGSVEFGRFVPSTIDALNWLEQNQGIAKVIVGGLCGGAITGLLAAARDKRISSLLGLGIPATSSAVTLTDPYKYVSKGQLQGLKKGYVRNLFRPKRWWRLITFQSDFKMIAKVLFSSFKSTVPHENSGDAGTNSQTETSNLNPLFIEGILKMFQTKRKCCLIFSEVDRLYWEFEEKFLGQYREIFEKNRQLCNIHVVPQANHIFSFPAWEDQMMDIACKWLKAADNDKY